MQELHFNGHTAPVSLPSISKSGRNSLLHLYYSNKISSSRTGGKKKSSRAAGRDAFRTGMGGKAGRGISAAHTTASAPGRPSGRIGARSQHVSAAPTRSHGKHPCTEGHTGLTKRHRDEQGHARRKHQASLEHHSLLSVQYVHTHSLLHRLKPLRKRAS